MTNDEARNNDEARITDCHPERSEAQSKDPAELLFGFTTGFLDFARKLGHIRHSIIRTSFVIRASSFPSHLPVFYEVVWDFLQKTRWPLEDIAIAATQTHVRISEIKLIARACDRHVK